MIDRRRRDQAVWCVRSAEAMRARARGDDGDTTMTQINKLIDVIRQDDETHKQLNKSMQRERIEGRVTEIRSPSDPRIPDIETDEEIEIMADGCSLLVIETGSIERDQLIGTEVVPSIEEIMIDLDGIVIREQDEILLDAVRLDYSEDPAAPDLWLAAEDSGLARICWTQDDPAVRDLDLRDDAISGTMDPTPWLSTRQHLNLVAGNLLRGLRRLIESGRGRIGR